MAMAGSVANGQGQLIDYRGRLLNHMNLVHRPGERQLVSKLFIALGCEVRDTGEPYLFISIAPGNKDLLNNILFATEATPEQWRFEQELQRALTDYLPLAQAYAAFAQKFRTHPQRGTHFGIRYSSFAKLEATLSHLETELDPELKTRVQVVGVFRPNNPGSPTEQVMQAFLETDVVTTGSLSIAQHIELQAQRLEG
jgi:hypothetical protein